MPRGLVAMARSGGHCPLRVSGGILCSERGQSRDAFQAIRLEETSPRCNNEYYGVPTGWRGDDWLLIPIVYYISFGKRWLMSIHYPKRTYGPYCYFNQILKWCINLSHGSICITSSLKLPIWYLHPLMKLVAGDGLYEWPVKLHLTSGQGERIRPMCYSQHKKSTTTE